MAIRQVTRLVSPEEAVAESLAAGQDPITTHDEAGHELVQRPLSLVTEAPEAAPQAGPRVKVYHKRQTTMWLSDGTALGPEEEAMIPAEDADNPLIAPYILRLA